MGKEYNVCDDGFGTGEEGVKLDYIPINVRSMSGLGCLALPSIFCLGR